MASDLKSYTTMSDLRGYLEPNEVKQLLDTASDPRDHLILRFLWTTGCRVSELLMIKGGDIDFKRNTISMITLKRKNQRYVPRLVPIDNKTITMLQQYITHNNIDEDERVFTITRQRVWQIIRECGQRAKIHKVGRKGLHPHHLRHSHSVAWVKAKPTPQGLRELQNRLGHASIQSTAFYLQFNVMESLKDVEEIYGKF